VNGHSGEQETAGVLLDSVERLRRRLGPLDPRQVRAWQQMTPPRRLEMAFQAYQFALEVTRLSERQNHPDLAPLDLAWRVTRRMQGDPNLGPGDRVLPG